MEKPHLHSRHIFLTWVFIENIVYFFFVVSKNRLICELYHFGIWYIWFLNDAWCTKSKLTVKIMVTFFFFILMEWNVEEFRKCKKTGYKLGFSLTSNKPLLLNIAFFCFYYENV